MSTSDLLRGLWSASAAGPVGDPGAWTDLLLADRLLRSARVTLEASVGGRLIRAAVAPVRVYHASAGVTYTYAPSLVSEPVFERSIDLDQQDAQVRQAQVTIRAAAVDPSAILLTGGAVRGVCEVAVQVDGGRYEDRRVVMRGEVAGASFGANGEFVDLTLRDPAFISHSLIPREAIDAVRWPYARADAIGRRYPLVINGAGNVPAPVVDHFGSGSYVRLAAYSGTSGLTVSAVRLDGSAVLTYSQVDEADGSGTVVRVVTIPAASIPTAGERSSYSVDVDLVDAAAAVDVAAVARRALTDFSATGEAGIDAYAFGRAAAMAPGIYPRVLINASGEDAVTALEWVSGNLLSQVPSLRLSYDRGGLGLVHLDRRRRTYGDAPRLLVGRSYPLADRASGYEESPDLYTSFEVRYGLDPLTNAYAGVLVRDPSNSVSCKRAATVIGGLRPHDPIDLPYLQDPTEAAYVIDWLVAHRAIPWYAVTWTAYPAGPWGLELGENVRYTDPAFPAFQECRATVLRLSPAVGGAPAAIGLAVWHPGWD